MDDIVKNACFRTDVTRQMVAFFAGEVEFVAAHMIHFCVTDSDEKIVLGRKILLDCLEGQNRQSQIEIAGDECAVNCERNHPVITVFGESNGQLSDLARCQTKPDSSHSTCLSHS